VIDVTLTVGLEGEEAFKVRPSLGSWLKWEREFNRSVASLASEQKASDVAWVAWEAGRHAGQAVPATFDEFLDRLETLEIESNSDPLTESPSPTESPS